MGDTLRSVDLERTSVGRYTVHNVRGGSISIGGGEDADFTPVELLLAAIGGCTAVDVDLITSRWAEPVEFSVGQPLGLELRRPRCGQRLRSRVVNRTSSAFWHCEVWGEFDRLLMCERVGAAEVPQPVVRVEPPNNR